jgi:hypothetical protein
MILITWLSCFGTTLQLVSDVDSTALLKLAFASVHLLKKDQNSNHQNRHINTKSDIKLKQRSRD